MISLTIITIIQITISIYKEQKLSLITSYNVYMIIYIQENQTFQSISKLYVKKHVQKCNGNHRLMVETHSYLLSLLQVVSNLITYQTEEKMLFIQHLYNISNLLRCMCFMYLHKIAMDSSRQKRLVARH